MRFSSGTFWSWIVAAGCSGATVAPDPPLRTTVRPIEPSPQEPVESPPPPAHVEPIAEEPAPPPPDPRTSSPPPEPAPREPALAGPFLAILEAHNRHRERHCAPALEWSAEIAAGAQAWADRLAARGCAFAHSGTRLGENLAGATRGTMTGADVADLWYGEAARYDFRRPGYSPQSGHFTQVVWAGTRRLGCGTTVCAGNEIWVCRYDPAGNMEGDFERNVLASTCRR